MLNRDLIRTINADIDEALKGVAEKHNVNIALGGGTFSDVEYRTKLTVKTENAKDKEKETSKIYAKMLGLPEDIVGKTITLRGEKYKVERIDMKKRKYPIIATSEKTGKTYKLPTDMISVAV